MVVSPVDLLLVASGAVTAAGGLAAAVVPRPFLRLTFGVESIDGATMFFVRHWGVLIFVVGALIVTSAYAPAARVPVLIAGATEKFLIVPLVFFGPLKRTSGMTVAAIADGLFAISYVVMLFTLS